MGFEVLVPSGMDAALIGAASAQLPQEEDDDNAREDKAAGDPAPDASAAHVWMEEAPMGCRCSQELPRGGR